MFLLANLALLQLTNNPQLPVANSIFSTKFDLEPLIKLQTVQLYQNPEREAISL